MKILKHDFEKGLITNGRRTERWQPFRVAGWVIMFIKTFRIPESEKHRLPLGVCQHSRLLCGGCHLNSHGAWSIWTQQCRHDSRTSTVENFLPVFAVPSAWWYTHGIYSVPRPTHHTFRVHSIYNLAVTLVLVGLSRLFVLVAIKNLPATTVRA